MLPLQAARSGAQLGHRNRWCVVDEERQVVQLAAGLEDGVEIVIRKLATAHGIGAHLGALGQDPGGKLFGRHLE